LLPNSRRAAPPICPDLIFDRHSRVLDGGITDVPGRSSDAVPRALDLGGRTRALPQSGGKSGDAMRARFVIACLCG